MAIVNMFTLSVRGLTLDVKIWRLQTYRRQILTSKAGPRASRLVELFYVLYHPLTNLSSVSEMFVMHNMGQCIADDMLVRQSLA